MASRFPPNTGSYTRETNIMFVFMSPYEGDNRVLLFQKKSNQFVERFGAYWTFYKTCTEGKPVEDVYTDFIEQYMLDDEDFEVPDGTEPAYQAGFLDFWENVDDPVVETDHKKRVVGTNYTIRTKVPEHIWQRDWYDVDRDVSPEDDSIGTYIIDVSIVKLISHGRKNTSEPELSVYNLNQKEPINRKTYDIARKYGLLNQTRTKRRRVSPSSIMFR